MAQTKIKAGLFEGVIGNGTDGYFLMSNGDGTMTWSSVVINPTIASIAYPGSATAADPAGGETITVTGTGFKTGATVTIGGTAAPAVSYVSATQITFTTPAKAAGDYDIVVTNTDTGSATFINGISYNGIPTWTTPAGSLGTFASGATISTITLQATEPDAGTITFNITNGALPTGLSLTGANIDGTTTLETADTLYTFTVTATDDESQATPRTFTITVTKQFIGTENFTINTYTGNGSTQSIDGKIGTAASFNGSSSKLIASGFAQPTGDVSVSMWINFNSISSAQKEFLDWVGNSSVPTIRINTYNSSDLRFAIGNGSRYISADSLSVTTGVWYHIAYSLDRSANAATLYFNGQALGSTITISGSSSDTQGLFIGSNHDENRFSDCIIDQVRIFDKALSSSEVTTLYGESNTSTTKSTTDIFNDGSGVALYEFEEGAKDTGGVTGYIGDGGIFNGTNYIVTPELGDRTTFSYSFWMNMSNASDSDKFIFGEQVGGQIFVSSGALRIYSNSATRNFSGSPTVSNDTWHHIVLSVSSGTATVYVDNINKGTSSDTSTAITAPLYMGTASTAVGNTTYAMQGVLDQVRIFNKAISSSEVTALYGETSASATKSTTDIFSDSSGIALYELEGNANDTGGVTGRTSGTEAAVFTNADNSSFNLGNATVVNNSFGVSFWVKMNKISQSENVYLCSFMYGSNTSLYMDTNNVLQVSNGGYSRNESFSTTHTFAVDTWYHIVYTGQIAGDSTLRCYVNGTQVGSRGWISGHNYTLTSGNTIGSYSNADNSIDGNIADFRIYKSTYLSASDVTALYSGTPPTTGLTEFYSFNGNDTDAQGNRTLTASNVIYNYNGTATNVSYAYDGTPTNVSFVGTSFQPDLVWVKDRDASYSHQLYDSVRGATKKLLPNTTAAESTDSTGLTAFDSNGFTISTNVGINTNNNDYVGWCWKAGGSSNTFNVDGTGYSTASAAGLSASNTTTMVGASVNTAAGFSVIRYNTNAPAGSPANRPAHGLGVEPKLILFRPITSTNLNWYAMHKLVDGSIDFLYLNLTNANSNSANSEFINTTHFGTDFGSSWGNIIAYCFADVDGYQKIGSYTGTGASGNVVTTGFRPRWVMIKNTAGGYSWVITDSVRQTGKILYPNLSNAEFSLSTGITSFDSDGFTLGSDVSHNNSGDTFIYLAIA